MAFGMAWDMVAFADAGVGAGRWATASTAENATTNTDARSIARGEAAIMVVQGNRTSKDAQ
jgi:hypothetical protein